jgi:hypothetical protein
VADSDFRKNPVDSVTSLFDIIKRWRDPYESRWKRFYKLYRSYRDVQTTTLKSNIFVPYIFSIVESIVPKMLGTLFNTRPIISVMPRGGEYGGLAKLLEKVLEYQLDEDQLELFSKILEFFKEAVIYGTSFAKVIPRFGDDDLVSFNYIDMEPVDLFNIYPDYRAKSIKRMKFIIQLSYVDYDELESLYTQKFYKNVPQLLNMLESMAIVDEAKRKRLTSVGILDEYGFDPDRKIIEVLEYWDRDQIYTVGARRVLLKEEDNPLGKLLPFMMARYIPVQHELYGIGIPEISESLQEELNSVRNQRADNVNLIINRMFIANKYADIDFDSLVSYPGNVILTNDVTAIKDLDTRDVTKSAYMEEEIIKRDIDNATGEYEYSRGATPPRRETATGIVRLQQASNIRFDTVVKLVEFTIIRSIAKAFLWLDYHFLPREDFIKIVGEGDYQRNQGDLFYSQDLDEILKMFHFQPMGSSTTAVKEVRIQQIMQAYKLFNQDPFVNQIELRKLVMDVLDLKNQSRLLIEDPVKYAQMILAQAQEQGGGPPPGGGPGGPPHPGQPQKGPQGPPAKRPQAKGQSQGPPSQMPPQVPQPGRGTQPLERQLSEMLKISGGGMSRTGGMPAAQVMA